MKRIKKFSFYIIILSIFLTACGQQDKQDAERLSQLNGEVENLFNDEMNDLAEDLSAEKFEEVKKSIEEENEEELNEENTQYFIEIKNSYLNALDMQTLETDIEQLFTEKQLNEEFGEKEIELLSQRLSEINAEKWTNYVTRQEEKLAEAEGQITKIQDAETLVNDLYLDGDRVNRDASREDEKAAQEAVAEVKNDNLRLELEERLEKVNQTLTKAEEEYKKATTGLGYFEGMYLSYDNYILYLDEDDFYIAYNDASDHMAVYELTDILTNTGKELKLALYESPLEAFGVEGGDYEKMFYLSDDYQTVTTEDGNEYHRLNQEEINEIYERLPGLQKP